MRASLAWAFALALAACGGSTAQESTAGGTGPTGHGGSGGDGGGGTGGTGGGAPAQTAGLCDEVNVTSWSCTPNNYHDPLVSYVRDASVIFRGKVTALHAVTAGFDGQIDTARTVVVHVDQVLFAGGMLEIGGQDVTVSLLAAPTMAVGYDGYFFADLWLLGQSIAVTEVAHMDPGVYPTLDADVPGIEALLADQRLAARMGTAAAVVVGTVASTTPPFHTEPFSEHDPLWAGATITVDCALRAPLPAASVTAAFPTSGDIAWTNSPVLQAGQQGVFLLQPVPLPQGPNGIPDGVGYVVSQPADVMPIGERAHVATLQLCPPEP